MPEKRNDEWHTYSTSRRSYANPFWFMERMGVWGNRQSLGEARKKQNTTSWTTLIRCLLPPWEALPDSGAVNASVLFLDPVSIPACIFSYINYPNIWPWSLWYRKWSRWWIFITKRKEQAGLFKVEVPDILAAVGHINACREEANSPLPLPFLPALTKYTSVTSPKCGPPHHMVGPHPSAWQPPCST